MGTPRYATIHARLGRYRGRAAEKDCCVCGEPAYAWAYQHGCEDELTELRAGRPGRSEHLVPYCAHLEHYSPMCDSCHRKLDNPHGEANGMTTLTEAEVMEIRQKYATGKFSTSQLGPLYGLSTSAIQKIISGINWAYLPTVTGFKRIGNAKLTYQQAEEIRTIYAAGGVSQKELSRRYGVIENTVWRIVNNKAYKNPESGNSFA